MLYLADVIAIYMIVADVITTNIFSDLRKPGLVPGKSLSPAKNICSVMEKT